MFSCTFPAVTGKALSGRLIKSLVTTLCFQSFQMLRFPSLRQVAFSEVRVIGYYWVIGLGLLQEELQSIASLSALVQTGSSVCVLQEALQVPPASPIPGRIFPLFFFFLLHSAFLKAEDFLAAVLLWAPCLGSRPCSAVGALRSWV